MKSKPRLYVYVLVQNSSVEGVFSSVKKADAWVKKNVEKGFRQYYWMDKFELDNVPTEQEK